MDRFTFQGSPARVLFDRPFAEGVGEALDALKVQRAFLVAGPGPEAAAAKILHAALGRRAVALSLDAAMHTPVDVTERVLTLLTQSGADGLVALGGGSSIGLSKALALRTGLPQVVVPTTYAGSEATPILGQTEQGRKTTLRADAVLPRAIVYDVGLTLTLPAKLSATSGLNAIAHAVEALYAQDANPVISLLAEDAIRRLSGALPAVVADPADRAARSEALYGAWACGTCLGAVGMSLHHKLCHVLGGSFDMPHAETHAVVLPHVAAFNRQAAPEALRRVAQALSARDAAEGLYDLAATLGAPTSLRQIGLDASSLDRAADLAVASPYWNPRTVDRAGVRELLDDAYQGRRPSTKVN
jgi:alcohol dehydrogenase class IV